MSSKFFWLVYSTILHRRCEKTYPIYSALRNHLKTNHDHVRVGMNLKSSWSVVSSLLMLEPLS